MHSDGSPAPSPNPPQVWFTDTFYRAAIGEIDEEREEENMMVKDLELVK